MTQSHQYWMKKAIAQAKKATTPYGAILVESSENYVEAYNTTKTDGPQAHAEMNAIKKMQQLSAAHPKDLTLYTTVEPCPMCMSAIVWAGIGHVVYGANIDDASQHGHQIHITSQEIANKAWYKVKLTPEVEREACLNLF